MTYFELFGIPVQLKVDTVPLSGRFFALSKQYHPDFFANEDEETREEALEKSALLNKAWKTFQNPDETIRYVLRLKGLLEEEEKFQLSPDFLLEVMEINEALMEPEDVNLADLENRINTLQSDIYEPVKEMVEHYQEAIVPKEALLQVKDYYFKKKYLDRIRRQLAGMA
ncbi:MAG: Fe-S protein assembly co-chaperone HscB [Sphingobacteriales bacterium]|nr:Fe-S protein assembly co-chaperone HscB [Sphingobacteriales bacterium]